MYSSLCPWKHNGAAAADANGKRYTLSSVATLPNLFRVVANSPAALQGYIDFNSAASKGKLSAQTRERVALAVAEINSCGYCLAAHTYLAGNVAKLDEAEIVANRKGASSDPKADSHTPQRRNDRGYRRRRRSRWSTRRGLRTRWCGSDPGACQRIASIVKNTASSFEDIHRVRRPVNKASRKRHSRRWFRRVGLA